MNGTLEEINNQNKTVTSNGIITPDDGYTGLGQVTVNVPQEGGGVKLFNSIDEMNQSTGNKDGDLAVVYDKSAVQNWKENTESDVLVLPETFTLPRPLEDGENFEFKFEPADEINTGRVSISGALSKSDVGMSIKVDMTNATSFYKTNDNQTFTVTNGIEESAPYYGTIQLPCKIKFVPQTRGEKVYDWDDIIGYLIQTKSPEYTGLYVYQDSTWRLAETQLTLSKPSQLQKDIIGYGSNGIITGTFEGGGSSDLTINCISSTEYPSTDDWDIWVNNEDTTPPDIVFNIKSDEEISEYPCESTLEEISDVSKPEDFSYEDGSCSAYANGIAYIFGSSHAYKYNVSENTVTEIATPPTSFTLDGRTAIIDNDIFIFYNDGETHTNYKYNIITNSYTKIADPSDNRVNCAPVVIDNEIYLLGGNIYSESTVTYPTTFVLKYDTQGDSYSEFSTDVDNMISKSDYEDCYFATLTDDNNIIIVTKNWVYKMDKSFNDYPSKLVYDEAYHINSNGWRSISYCNNKLMVCTGDRYIDDGMMIFDTASNDLFEYNHGFGDKQIATAFSTGTDIIFFDWNVNKLKLYNPDFSKNTVIIYPEILARVKDTLTLHSTSVQDVNKNLINVSFPYFMIKFYNSKTKQFEFDNININD